MVELRRPLGAIEHMLHDAPLAEEERSALWLLAWSLHDRIESAEPVELKLVPDPAAMEERS